jgi:DNA mismatch repair ATPase MutS
MKVFLAYPDRDLDPEAALPANADALTQDLGLDILLNAMAGGDRYLRHVARTAVLDSLEDPAVIRYRQAVLDDCLAYPELARGLYAIAVEAIEKERRAWGYTARYPVSLLRRSVQVMGEFVRLLQQLRAMGEEHASSLRSDGFRRLFAEVIRELDDAYLRETQAHLRRLEFRDGIRVSAELGPANRGTRYVLRRRVGRRGWRERIHLPEADSYTWELPPRDEAGSQALGELRSRGIALAADALARSVDHILSYFVQLRAELGFYVACLNLRDVLAAKGEPICLPEPLDRGRPGITAAGLYDVCLSLSLGRARAVANDVDADGRSLLVITGANRGGKSTFLRSLGQAQLMLQAGMFVAATSFRADLRTGLFTHFKREEDAELRSGKLDEELGRMSTIVDLVAPGSLVLLNESFASTNEREGSEIGRQIVRALLEAGVKVGYVTHMYDLAGGLAAERNGDALFLRAERLPDGRRTFRLVEGPPLPTSHGEDIYRRIFADAGAGATVSEADGPARPEEPS